MSEGELVEGERSPAIELRDIVKHYGAVEALRRVSFSVQRNEIVGLIGDNGAGKSTTIKLMSGVTRPSRGSIEFEGTPIVLHSPTDALRKGIETVYQDLALAADLSVWENFYLGREIHLGGPMRYLHVNNRRQMIEHTREALDGLQIKIQDVRARCRDLSGGQRQAIGVGRAITWGSRLLLLDEPTAALGVAQTERVGALMQQAKSRGIAVLLVSHDLPWVKENCDRIIVLYRGTITADLQAATTSLEEMIGYITGSVGVDAR